MLLGSGLWAAAQARNTNLTTRIENTDNIMSIEVNGNARGKDISYIRQFRVAGMSRSQKEALKKTVSRLARC
ncbi:hypothetical protein [Spirosoma sp. 209]|uniref:hypothetical protein n=1 Tax=Spirosoma sp. 209 TaxID=1955701 RepID=UPI00098D34A0|nr:hypothetical protein [Spirosoma sp. 209]